MAKRTPAEVYAGLIAAGFSPDAATVMTAIAGAESGYDNRVLGDTGLQDNTWGPSYGLFQIRTLKRDTGTGSNRDINRLAASDLEQAKAAFAISGGGVNFGPWSVYNTGAYRQYLGAATSAAKASPAGDGDGPFPTVGPGWLPWNWPSLAGNELAGGVQVQTLGGVRHIALEGLAVVVALGLAVAGLYLLARPAVHRALGPQRAARRAVVGS